MIKTSLRFCNCDQIQQDLHKKITSLIKELPTGDISRILDVGCWNGAKTEEYGKAVSLPKENIFGLEIVDEQMKEASKRINCFRVDLEKDDFPFKNEFFDLVIANQVFEHLKNIYKPMSEINRVLKEGGFLIFSVPNLSGLHNRIMMLLGWQPTSMRIIGPHVRGFSYRDTQKFLELNGHFKLIKRVGVGFYPSFYPITDLLASLFKGFSHSVIWVAKKQKSKLKDWQQEISSLDFQSEF